MEKGYQFHPCYKGNYYLSIMVPLKKNQRSTLYLSWFQFCSPPKSKMQDRGFDKKKFHILSLLFYKFKCRKCLKVRCILLNTCFLTLMQFIELPEFSSWLYQFCKYNDSKIIQILIVILMNLNSGVARPSDYERNIKPTRPGDKQKYQIPALLIGVLIHFRIIVKSSMKVRHFYQTLVQQ